MNNQIKESKKQTQTSSSLRMAQTPKLKLDNLDDISEDSQVGNFTLLNAAVKAEHIRNLSNRSAFYSLGRALERGASPSSRGFSQRGSYRIKDSNQRNPITPRSRNSKGSQFLDIDDFTS